jgi:CRP/FNR family transcriptional regulator
MSIKGQLEGLRLCSLFADLDVTILEKLAGCATHISLKRGELLFNHGDHADAFYVVISGTLKVYRVASDGREQVLHLFGSGEVCGEVPVFEGSDYPASAAAANPCSVLRIPATRFLEACRKHPEVPIKMLATLSRRLRRFADLIDALSLKSVEDRLLDYLEGLSRDQGTGTIVLPYSKATLASRLGTIPETLSRSLKKLEIAGQLTVDGPNITLHTV